MAEPRKLKLTREVRYALVHSDEFKLPAITFDGDKPCPVEVGHVEVLTPNVKLEITEIRRNAKGEHSLVYTLHNNRNGQRFISRRGNYTFSGGSDIDREAGEAVDAFTQKRITREARERERQEAANVIAAAEDVMAAIRERAESSPEFKREARLTLHRMRRELDRFIVRQKRKVA